MGQAAHRHITRSAQVSLWNTFMHVIFMIAIATFPFLCFAFCSMRRNLSCCCCCPRQPEQNGCEHWQIRADKMVKKFLDRAFHLHTHTTKTSLMGGQAKAAWNYLCQAFGSSQAAHNSHEHREQWCCVGLWWRLLHICTVGTSWVVTCDGMHGPMIQA